MFLSENDGIPDNLSSLNIEDGPLVDVIKVNEEKFYELTLSRKNLLWNLIYFLALDTIVAVFITAQNELDTTLEVLKRPDTLIAFNDDVAADNTNPLVVSFS